LHAPLPRGLADFGQSERFRLALIRALLLDRPFLALDDPFRVLDEQTWRRLIPLLQLQKEFCGILIACRQLPSRLSPKISSALPGPGAIFLMPVPPWSPLRAKSFFVAPPNSAEDGSMKTITYALVLIGILSCSGLPLAEREQRQKRYVLQTEGKGQYGLPAGDWLDGQKSCRPLEGTAMEQLAPRVRSSLKTKSKCQVLSPEREAENRFVTYKLVLESFEEQGKMYCLKI
jgi:hypothetical protein